MSAGGEDGRRPTAAGGSTTGAGPVPPTVEGYDRFALLGRGGFATVWTARQISVERDVAVKVLDQALLDDDAVARFRSESSTLAELSWHPTVVHIYDTGTTSDGRPYIAMEHLTGGTLGAAVRRDGPMGSADVTRIGAAISDAVASAHDAGVLHRDIKPDNVLLDRRGEARLADFGIARIASESTTITGGAFRGTVLHAAPELFDGEQPSVATDLWSIGSTLYTLAAGHPPFARPDATEDSVSAIIRRTLLDEPPTLPDDVDAELGRIILSCLAKEPQRRPSSAADLRRQLLGEPAPSTTAIPAAASTGEAGAGTGRGGSNRERTDGGRQPSETSRPADVRPTRHRSARLRSDRARRGRARRVELDRRGRGRRPDQLDRRAGDGQRADDDTTDDHAQRRRATRRGEQPPTGRRHRPGRHLGRAPVAARVVRSDDDR